MSNLSRRDNRTQPGVSTPGTAHHRPALKGRQRIGYRWFVRSTSTLEGVILPPLQGGPPILSTPAVKTPGLVLSSLRDKFGCPDGTTGSAIPKNRVGAPT